MEIPRKRRNVGVKESTLRFNDVQSLRFVLGEQSQHIPQTEVGLDDVEITQRDGECRLPDQ
jgi:hypothetical protein